MNTTLLPCDYFPCIAWFQQFLTDMHTIEIEQHEHFVRASMRNRCYIAGSNGVIALTIPLAGGRNQKTPMSDVQVSYDTNWRALHWKTIESCYRRSPYFDYYAEDVKRFYEQEFNLLVEWNLASIALVQRLLFTNVMFTPTAEYHSSSELSDTQDCRLTWNATNYQQSANEVTYWQTFQDKIGFQPNLSILDGLFCEGKPLLQSIYTT